jgi:hypothetical protein
MHVCECVNVYEYVSMHSLSRSSSSCCVLYVVRVRVCVRAFKCVRVQILWPPLPINSHLDINYILFY